ncbi:acyltransferase family protein [Acidicapsa acidisoli]|uniref:acyltransferase family protein n=1 Tax=Acidicapsa acidisoli TaxID=1615681 RepID=UPI0021DF6A57|nr:acyltransferase [Acidicapsa acidisoli]
MTQTGNVLGALDSGLDKKPDRLSDQRLDISFDQGLTSKMMQRIRPKSENRPEKIHALTSLRFFAALLVVFYHTLWTAIPSLTHASILGRMLSLGFLSVSFFFLLSGYILGAVYLRGERPVRKSSFYAARFARIYPLFFLTLVVDTPTLLTERIAHYGWHSAVIKTTVTFFANIVMLQAWIPNLRGIDNPNWSLSVETIFYLLFPFIGIWIWKLSGRKVWIVATTIWVASQLFTYLAAPHLPTAVIELNPLIHLPTFALGIFVARWQSIHREHRKSAANESREVALALLFALIGIVAVVHWFPHLSIDTLGNGMMVPIFACLIWAFSANRILPAKILSAKWMVVLGEASFGLYLIHIPAYHLFEALQWQKIPALYPVYLGASIGLSVVSFYWIETPSRKWILNRLQARSKETMEVASDAQ